MVGEMTSPRAVVTGHSGCPRDLSMIPLLLSLLLGSHEVSSFASHTLPSPHCDVPSHLTPKGRASTPWAGDESQGEPSLQMTLSSILIPAMEAE